MSPSNSTGRHSTAALTALSCVILVALLLLAEAGLSLFHERGDRL